ncbi:MAG: MgtC/SapB family protein [Acidobacteriaceae bacterium]
MPVYPTWGSIALRLFLAVVAGTLIGINRDERGRAAGLRTTLLVCLAACVAMLQANLLMSTAGKPPTSFVSMDVMRLPLGILSGIGFIGAGAIIKRGDRARGVTTAATIWFVTVLGLCFGGGQNVLGVVALVLALVVLSVMRRIEKRIPRYREASLIAKLTEGAPPEEELRTVLERGGVRLRNWSVVYDEAGKPCRVESSAQWRVRDGEIGPPAAVQELSRRSGVSELSWRTGQ